MNSKSWLPVLLLVITCTVSCSLPKEPVRTQSLSLMDSLKRTADSIKVENIVVHNLFKSQVLAHRDSGKYDSLMILNGVYLPHKKLWDNCYGTIFGSENASRFNTTAGMMAWNRTLYLDNKTLFNDKIRKLLAMNLDSILTVNLRKFNKMAGYKPKAVISILFTPIQGIGFGGCDATQFALELNYINNDLDYTINKGIPHELNHLAYEPNRMKDPKHDTALAQTIDEGFACYFTWVFFNGAISKHQAVENMSAADWNWYLTHEKEIFQKVNKYFDETGENPLLRNNKFKLFPDVPKTLFYWLGFRIVEAYVQNNGSDSWKDLYRLPSGEIFKRSRYGDQFVQ
ncbi:DUF2268 domain-containing putative Zn-dependent protease [Pedobacter duraquae]|uniref:Putative Zn-dependent protease DUF2268 n=1 Tax=Pedobacter duraquae TaxID=425511 RepID=A0A4R6IF07_9SPHI|nr:DUF2268 domain-containing putative Zn-dependent protease [Pedobacter duraquae]TDO20301.1 putative Zn-dependent protease DUF2268 [Pedobacter duraquae]